MNKTAKITTDEKTRWVQFGKEQGRAELINEIIELLKIDERIAEAVGKHIEQWHE